MDVGVIRAGGGAGRRGIERGHGCVGGVWVRRGGSQAAI